MNQDTPTQITLALRQAEEGDREANERLAALVYDDLRQLAAGIMKGERYGHTLQPTALVHEAYARLMVQGALERSAGRQYFFAAAARAMRQVLVDHARQRAAAKRLGQAVRVPFEHAIMKYESNGMDLLEVDEALNQLATLNERQGRIIELRYFGGLTVPEVAQLLGVSVSLIESEFRVARAFLRSRLSPGTS